MTPRPTRRSAVASLVAAFAATGAAFKMTSATSSARAKATEHQVEITGFEFVPSVVKVKPGDTITWINRDIAPHTATASDESWDTSKIERNKQKSVTVAPGMVGSYFCRFHPVMKAELKIIAE